MEQKSVYDENRFFEKYSQMLRSEKGLAGAGEWPTLQKMLPDCSGKRVLDIGCGFGWHCRYAAEHGAAEVVGFDLSEKMLSVARQKNSAPQITYQQAAIETYPYPDRAYDLVFSSLALHYVADFTGLLPKIAGSLVTGGDFVFSVEHPVFTAYGSQNWIYDPAGKILHWPVDRYFAEGERRAVFLGEPVTKQHKTLTTYLGGLLRHGFAITGVAEPMPPQEMMTLPGMQEELRRPMMLLVSAKKL